MIDHLRSRIPKSLEQIEAVLQSDPAKLFSSGRYLCKIKAMSISVEKIIRTLKSNLEREAYFHNNFYRERERHLSQNFIVWVWGRGCSCLLSRLHRLTAAYVTTSSESKTVYSV